MVDQVLIPPCQKSAGQLPGTGKLLLELALSPPEHQRIPVLQSLFIISLHPEQFELFRRLLGDVLIEPEEGAVLPVSLDVEDPRLPPGHGAVHSLPGKELLGRLLERLQRQVRRLGAGVVVLLPDRVLDLVDVGFVVRVRHDFVGNEGPPSELIIVVDVPICQLAFLLGRVFGKVQHVVQQHVLKGRVNIPVRVPVLLHWPLNWYFGVLDHQHLPLCHLNLYLSR